MRGFHKGRIHQVNLVEWVHQCFDRLEQGDKYIHAFTRLRQRQAILKDAQASSDRWKAGRPLSAVDGMPIAIKANIATQHLPTCCGSRMLSGKKVVNNSLVEQDSPFDATVVTLLKEAGALVMGKTNMDEFGMGSYNVHSAHGPTFNPHSFPGFESNQDPFVAGGSSGASAAAVAADFCLTALGSDTGGSVRLPASYCGVYGYKPSYGRFSRWGLVSYASSLDTVGILGQSMENIQQVMGMKKEQGFIPDILSVQDTMDATSLHFEKTHPSFNGDQPLKGIHIGIPQEYQVEGLHAAVQSAWDSTARTCQQLGATLVPISLPLTQAAVYSYYVIAPAEASSNLARYDGIRYGKSNNLNSWLGRVPLDTHLSKEPLHIQARTRGFGKQVQQRLMLGTFVLQANEYNSYFLQAQKVRRLVMQELDATFKRDRYQPHLIHKDTHRVDYILTPSSVSHAPRLSHVQQADPLEEYTNDIMTIPASLAGLPALSFPAGQVKVDQYTLPIGLQLVGQFGQDEGVLSMGNILQHRNESIFR